MNRSAIIIGAGIVGLATARALAMNGFKVTVVERSPLANGASIRNFGMIWPVGQPDGPLYERALKSRSIWKNIADKMGFWYSDCGSLHLAYNSEEWAVLNELTEIFSTNERNIKILDKNVVLEKFNGINPRSLIGAMFSETELIVDPREAIRRLPEYLSENYAVKFIWNKSVNHVETGKVWTGNEILQADVIYICSGADFETLYPEKFDGIGLTKCKLQMMRFASRDKDFRIGTAICGGLSLVHYESFKVAPSLTILKQKYAREMENYLNLGIHVMVSQNGRGELTVGDSHQYGMTFSPFDEASINDLIIDYLRTFASIENWRLIQTWHGIYPKMIHGETDIFLETDPGVFIVNGLGGAGMTLSFGFAEEIVAKFS
jgi:FAD dependent oxidoreductase TIGR03364